MLVSFDVAGREYALALDVVQEIIDTPNALAATPAREARVLGVMPFRDTVLPLLSLRGLLGFTGSAERADREKIVVTRVGGALVGLLADRMRSIFFGRCRPDREDPAGAVGAGGRGKPRSRRSIAAKTDVGWCRFWRRSSCSGRKSCSG